MSIETYTKALYGPGVDSETRMYAMLSMLWKKPPDTMMFWDVLAEFYSCCDCTWPWRSDLLYLMRNNRARPLIEQPLTFPLRIYRGCERDRVRGISWTTDRKVAEQFAHGHRSIPVEDSVIAEAVVDRSAVFLAISNREEQEVLIDPRRLRQLRITQVLP